MKFIKFLIRYKWAILASFSGPILVNIITLIPAIPFVTYGTTDNWMGFFGNYSGGIIGGVVAYLVAKKQGDDLKKLEDEKSSLSIRPYLRIKEIATTEFEKPFTVTLSGESKQTQVSANYLCVFENIGLGTAVNIRFLTGPEITGIGSQIFEITLLVAERQNVHIIMNVPITKLSERQYEIKLAFNDLIGNRYFQKFVFLKFYNQTTGLLEMKLIESGAPQIMAE